MSCQNQTKMSRPEAVKNYYIQQIVATDSLLKQLKHALETKKDEKTIQTLFKQARLAYKKTEFLAEYYMPATAKSINGAPIPEMDENDQHKIEAPEGFQVIEPLLFPIYNYKNEQAEVLIALNSILIGFKRLKTMAERQELANQQIFDALRLQSFRVITLGISGFDAPVAQNSMNEVASSLTSIQDVLNLYQDDIKSKDEVLFNATNRLFTNATHYLKSNNDFNTFDRMVFIQQYANPISAAILKAAQILGNKKPQDLRALKAEAKTLFDKNAFDANFYTANFDAHSTKEKAALGKVLFYDAVLSGNGKRSCATCHNPAKAFTDGLPKSIAVDGKSVVRRNTPTLLYAGLQPALFFDNRVTYLEDQATAVITNKDEMHGSLPAAVAQLKKNKSYILLFQKAFAKDENPVNEYNLRNAIGSYIRSLGSFNSKFDQYVRGEKSQLTQQELKGFNLYMGKAKCGTCHFAPLFNGAIPPNFSQTETEILGVPIKPNSNLPDPDLGRFDLRKLALHKYAFKVPTLRNIAKTAPYMHNGAYQTLEQVMDFYNKGGGEGLGIHLENQTLAPEPLHLSKQEVKDVIAFLKTLDDK